MSNINTSTYSDEQEEYIPKVFKKPSRKHQNQRWTLEENLIYSAFLRNNRQLFEDQYTRRTTKVFKILSEAVGTKEPAQCKSHHQKMIKRYRNISTIAKAFAQTSHTKSVITKEVVVESKQSNSQLSTQLQKFDPKFQDSMERKIVCDSNSSIKTQSFEDQEDSLFDVLNF